MSDEVSESLLKIQKDRQDKCDHGVTFDVEVARRLMENTPDDPSIDPTLAFVMGSPAVPTIRKLYPRLSGLCPKGCGYNGIYYASYEHYIMGDY